MNLQQNAAGYSWVVGSLSDFNANGQNLFNFMSAPSGMELVSAEDALREHFKLPKNQGVVVVGLDAQSSPAQAGIQQNDVLLAVDEKPLAKPEDLDTYVKQAGDEPVALSILRGGKKITLQVQPHVRVILGPVQAAPPEFWIGTSVAPVGPALRSQLQLPSDRGLAVIDVAKDGPAAKAGIKVHDILLSMGGQPLLEREQLVTCVQAAGEKSVALELIREGKTQTIEITPQRRKTTAVRSGAGDLLSDRAYRFVQLHPGAVVSPNNSNLRWYYHGLNGSQNQPAQSYTWKKGENAAPAQPAASKDAVSKRLDDLDDEMKQLRKAIEELSRAMKTR